MTDGLKRLTKLLLLILLSLIVLFWKRETLANGVDITISVNPSEIKNNDFGQILGGYINTRSNLDPHSKFVLSQTYVINEARKMFPQPPEFPNPAVMRTQSNKMLEEDYFAITDAEVEDIIKFCSQAGCDPMFGALGEGPVQTHKIGGQDVTGKIIDTSAEAIRKRAVLVKAKCQQYFGDDRHCLNWDIGNEPPSTGACDFYGRQLIPTAIRAVREVIPNAVFHAPELYLDSAKVRDSNETIGECIIRTLQQTDPTLRLNVITTHWYPYICPSSPTALNVDGNAVLKWDGFGGPVYEKMTYPNNIVAGMRSWMRNYDTSKNAAIGIGEFNPMGACGPGESNAPGSNITYRVNISWGGAFWHLDTLGILAEAGIKYVQKHIHINGSGGYYETMVVTDGRVAKTPPYYAYRFYSQYFGKTIVSSQSSDPATVNSHASIDKDGNLRLILINKSGSGFKPGTANPPQAVPKKIKINIANFNAGSIGETYRMTAPINFKDNPPSFDETNFYKTQTNVPIGNSFEYIVPAYSAVIIKIPRQGGGPTSTPGATATLTPTQTQTPIPTRTPTPTSTPPPGSCSCSNGRQTKPRGDANCDGAIDIRDFNRWLQQFHSSPSQTDCADFNRDGRVDGIDFEYWRRGK